MDSFQYIAQLKTPVTPPTKKYIRGAPKPSDSDSDDDSDDDNTADAHTFKIPSKALPAREVGSSVSRPFYILPDPTDDVFGDSRVKAVPEKKEECHLPLTGISNNRNTDGTPTRASRFRCKVTGKRIFGHGTTDEDRPTYLNTSDHCQSTLESLAEFKLNAPPEAPTIPQLALLIRATATTTPPSSTSPSLTESQSDSKYKAKLTSALFFALSHYVEDDKRYKELSVYKIKWSIDLPECAKHCLFERDFPVVAREVRESRLWVGENSWKVSGDKFEEACRYLGMDCIVKAKKIEARKSREDAMNDILVDLSAEEKNGMGWENDWKNNTAVCLKGQETKIPDSWDNDEDQDGVAISEKLETNPYSWNDVINGVDELDEGVSLLEADEKTPGSEAGKKDNVVVRTQDSDFSAEEENEVVYAQELGWDTEYFSDFRTEEWGKMFVGLSQAQTTKDTGDLKSAGVRFAKAPW